MNLTHLQAVLQPERGDDERPWFVEALGGRLSLTDQGVSVDLNLLDDAGADEAVQREAAGLPSRALERYRHAIDLYQGPLLADLDVPWAELDRMPRSLIGPRRRGPRGRVAAGQGRERASHAP